MQASLKSVGLSTFPPPRHAWPGSPCLAAFSGGGGGIIGEFFHELPLCAMAQRSAAQYGSHFSGATCFWEWWRRRKLRSSGSSTAIDTAPWCAGCQGRQGRQGLQSLRLQSPRRVGIKDPGLLCCQVLPVVIARPLSLWDHGIMAIRLKWKDELAPSSVGKAVLNLAFIHLLFKFLMLL